MSTSLISHAVRAAFEADPTVLSRNVPSSPSALSRLRPSANPAIPRNHPFSSSATSSFRATAALIQPSSFTQLPTLPPPTVTPSTKACNTKTDTAKIRGGLPLTLEADGWGPDVGALSQYGREYDGVSAARTAVASIALS
jgi:hypothetical protein